MAKKSAKNIVEEWAKMVRSLAKIAYEQSDYRIKNEYLQRILGNCDAILATLDCCGDEDA